MARTCSQKLVSRGSKTNDARSCSTYINEARDGVLSYGSRHTSEGYGADLGGTLHGRAAIVLVVPRVLSDLLDVVGDVTNVIQNLRHVIDRVANCVAEVVEEVWVGSGGCQDGRQERSEDDGKSCELHLVLWLEGYSIVV